LALKYHNTRYSIGIFRAGLRGGGQTGALAPKVLVMGRQIVGLTKGEGANLFIVPGKKYIRSSTGYIQIN